MTEILLCNLELGHYRCFFHSTKEWAERLTRLKIYRSVFYLDNHVVSKLPIKRHKFGIGLFCAVFVIGAIYKGTPHHNTAIRLQSIRHRIGTIHMRASKILRARLPFAVCFYEEGQPGPQDF